MAWEYPTNFSNGTSVTGIGSFFSYMSYATGEWFATGVLAVIFIMVFIATSLVSFNKALASSSFVTLIFAGYFLRLGQVSVGVVFALIGMLIIGVLLSKSESRGY